MKYFSAKPIICFGSDSLNKLSQLTQGNILIVTDPYMANSGAVQKIKDKLINSKYIKIYTDVKPDPDEELVLRGVEVFKLEKPDIVIAFGGGSAIDATKAMNYKYMELNNSKPLFIAIPTTAGTGSEVTNFSIITKGEEKQVIIDDILLPDYAILDAQFTKTVPNNITADTGMDVLTHAIEAYFSLNASSFSDLFSKKAMETVLISLPKIYKDGDNLKERQKMIEASCMAGISFTNAGLGIVHSLAHILGGKFHIPHGRLNAILLPYVLSYYSNKCDKVRDKIQNLGIYLGIDEKVGLINHIKDLNYKLNIESNLKELGKININHFESIISELAEIAFNDRCTPTTPVIVTRQDLINILRDSFYGN